MSAWRRIVFSLLLACLPFQTVMGATGLACAIGAHHGAPAMPAPAAAPCEGHGPPAAHAAEHGHAAEPTHAVPAHEAAAPAASAPSAHAADSGHAGPGTCRFCLECCATAAPIPAIAQQPRGPDRILRVTLASVAVHATPSPDGLFRPPRT